MTNEASANIGILVTNLGTPLAPTTQAVRKYLAEFLWDPLIVQIPRPIWWLLLNGIILRTRPKRSAANYKKIWTSSGSPLLVFTSELMQKLQIATQNKGYQFKYALGMRYGQPSIKEALLTLRKEGVSELIVLPLYPQYSKPTTISTFLEIDRQLQSINWAPRLYPINDYRGEPSYIKALVESIQAHWQKQIPGQKLVFSFHGIPKKLINQGDPYYDQCLETANSVISALNINKKNVEIVFQSRFGREEWLQPYCSEVLQRLPKEGCKHIDVICPGFAVDCLETLEEMAITNKKLFHQAGGLTYNYIPALNDSEAHVESLSTLLMNHINKISIGN